MWCAEQYWHIHCVYNAQEVLISFKSAASKEDFRKDDPTFAREPLRKHVPFERRLRTSLPLVPGQTKLRKGRLYLKFFTSMGKKSAKPTSAPQRSKFDQKEKKQCSYHSGDLSAALQRWDLRIFQVKADGNCFFRAAVDQLEGANGDHMALRQKVVNFIRSHSDDFEPYMEDGESLDHYCRRMSEVSAPYLSYPQRKKSLEVAPSCSCT